MQNRQFSAKATVEAGLLSALILILMLLTAYVPFLSFLNILLPIPITLLYLRHDYKVGIGAVVVSGILIAMFYDPISALGSSINYGLTGLTLGYCIKKEFKASKTICFMALASGIGIICNVFILGLLATPEGFKGLAKQLDKVISMFNATMDQTKEFYSKFGMGEKQKELMNQMFKPITMEMIKSLALGLFVIGCFGAATINYFTARAILKKFRYKLVEVKPFSELYMSEKIGYVIAALAIVAMIMQGSKIQLGKYMITSIVGIIQFVFLIEGLAVASYFFKNRFKLSKGVMILIFFLTAIQFQFVYTVIGLMDIVIDFRKVNPNRLLKK